MHSSSSIPWYMFTMMKEYEQQMKKKSVLFLFQRVKFNIKQQRKKKKKKKATLMGDDFNWAIKPGNAWLLILNIHRYGCHFLPKIKWQYTTPTEQLAWNAIAKNCPLHHKRRNQQILVDPNYPAFIWGSEVKQEQGTAALQGERAATVVQYNNYCCSQRNVLDCMFHLSEKMIDTFAFFSPFFC